MSSDCIFEEMDSYFCSTVQTSVSTRGRENELLERFEMLMKEHASYGILQRFFAYTNFLNYTSINRGVLGSMLCPRLPILEESLIRAMIEEGGAKLFYGASTAEIGENTVSIRAHATIKTRTLEFHVDALSKDLRPLYGSAPLEIPLQMAQNKEFVPELYAMLKSFQLSDDDRGNIVTRVSALSLLCQPLETLAPDAIYFRIHPTAKNHRVALHCTREQVIVEDMLGAAPCLLKWRISYND